MVSDAESHATEDKQRREAIEKKNQLDSLIYGAEKTLSENGDKLPDEEKQNLEAALKEARDDLASEDAARIDAAHQRVEQATHKVAEVLYHAQQAEGAPADAAPGGDPAAGSGAAGEDVIDAEFTEEKDGDPS
jgi:molecular chaperone DnaK